MKLLALWILSSTLIYIPVNTRRPLKKQEPFSKTPPGSRSRREAANSGLDSTRRSVPDQELLRGIGTICSCTSECLQG